MTWRRWPATDRLAVLVLAVLAYLPSLTAAPGRMPADTKLYLYLDPGRLIADAPFSWDTRQFAGWVPHQTIAYLWPSGPWFWFFDLLGVPDWIAHRLWLGTILLVAGLGVRFAARLLGLTPLGALVAAVVYQLSPYVLAYVSRTSVMLLPWAGVGWLVGLTIRATARTRWRDAVLFALVVLTVGSVNATAIALIAPAPVLWLVHAAWQRHITPRVAWATAAKLGGLSLLVSLWWIVMLIVQGRHGADVLGFSETLEAVSLTSVSTETLRGLGYWLFYVRDPYAFTTTASIDYMNSGRVLLIGFVLLALCLGGLAWTRWSQRRFAALCVITGIVLAVGVHPFTSPSPLMSPWRDSALGLALRSSTRALPVSNFGFALGAGALVTAIGAIRVRRHQVAGMLAAGLVVVLAIGNLPALWHGGFVDPALERDADVPDAWADAAARLDAGSAEHRVLQLPGAEFGAFRWGYTVDPPLPGLTDKPLVTRDLLPLGSPGAMDLLYALDNRFQNGTIDAAAIAPVARLLAADTIWVTNDMAFDRFRTPRPEIISDLFHHGVPGLGTITPVGDPVSNRPDISVIDEQLLADARLGAALSPVELVDVNDPVAVIRVADSTVVVVGSGDGVIDAAAAGLIDGSEAIRYAVDLGAGSSLAQAPISLVVYTDSNRDRAMQWRGSQDVTGFTESGGPAADVTDVDTGDQRLEVFADPAAGDQTTAVLDTGLTVRASAYGEPFAYRPEDRAAMAVDGDPTTAWVVADRSDAIGHSITVGPLDGPLTLLQAADPAGHRSATRTITRVRVTSDDGSTSAELELDERSRTGPGQPIDLDVAGTTVTITIVDVAEQPDGTDSGRSAVGFAELGPVATEIVRLPTTAVPVAADTPVAVVLTRERVRPTDRWRSDPEAQLVREFTLPIGRSLSGSFTLRLAARATDEVLADVLGIVGAPVATARLTGVVDAQGSSAFDGNAETAWTTPFGASVGAGILVHPAAGSTLGSVVLHQPVDGLHSTISALRVRIGEVEADVVVPPPDPTGASVVELPAHDVVAGDRLEFVITAVKPAYTVDRRYAELVELPVAVEEIEGMPVAPISGAPPRDVCRTDLVVLDDAPLGIALDAAKIDALAAGEPVTVATCDRAPIALAAGVHTLTTANGLSTGIDVDRVVFSPIEATTDATVDGGGRPVVRVSRTRSTRTAVVDGCATGCWLILGEGYNRAWRASVAGGSSLGAPVQISGGFNGWWLPAGTDQRTVEMRWTPQRSLDISLTVAAMAVLACIALALADRRRHPLHHLDEPRLAAFDESVGRRPATIAAVALVIASALLIAPAWGAIALVPAVAVALTRRLRLLGALAVAGALTLGFVVVARQVRLQYFANAAWPGHFEDLHRPGLFVAVLIAGGSLFGAGSERSSVERGSDH